MYTSVWSHPDEQTPCLYRDKYSILCVLNLSYHLIPSMMLMNMYINKVYCYTKFSIQ